MKIRITIKSNDCVQVCHKVNMTNDFDSYSSAVKHIIDYLEQIDNYGVTRNITREDLSDWFGNEADEFLKTRYEVGNECINDLPDIENVEKFIEYLNPHLDTEYFSVLVPEMPDSELIDFLCDYDCGDEMIRYEILE